MLSRNFIYQARAEENRGWSQAKSKTVLKKSKSEKKEKLHNTLHYFKTFTQKSG